MNIGTSNTSIRVGIAAAVLTALVGVSTASSHNYEAQSFSNSNQVLSWDKDENPGNWSQNDLPQYKNTCGDDPNEYVIKEHDSNSDERTTNNDNHKYVCADRVTDCAFNGTVYSQGQAVNLGGENEENGTNIADLEVCLDDDQSMPGGEWYDMDDDRLNNLGPNALTEAQIGNLTRTHTETYDDKTGDVVNPVLNSLWGTYPGNGTINGEDEVIGYATEDDCDQELAACDDNGDQKTTDPLFSAGNFTEGVRQDNNRPNNNIGGVHNKIQDDSDQFESGAATETYLDGKYTLSDRPQYDSQPGPDNWTLSNFLNDSVSNTGRSLAAGRCYARSGISTREGIRDRTQAKIDRVFGNSFANASDIDGDGQEEGVWEDPDELSYSNLHFSCDLTRDRGLALNDSGSSSGNQIKDSGRVKFKGEVVFEKNNNGDLVEGMEGPVCGDDESEYFIETAGSPRKGELGTGEYMCADSPNTCVLPTGSGPEPFGTGSYVNVNEPGESEGVSKDDLEVCLNPGDSNNRDEPLKNPLHGVWYDQDYSETACSTNPLYGPAGVRWFDRSSVKEFPYAFTGGVDDDYNDYLKERGEDTHDSNVSTGTSGEKVLSMGFCGGDDDREQLVSQVCPSDLCKTDRSIMGVAKQDSSCVYDGRDIYEDVPQPVKRDGEKTQNRSIYQQGESITLDYQQKQNITCVGGKWFSEGPIAFNKDTLDVPLGGSATAGFSVVNLGNLRETYEVTIQEDTQAGTFSNVDGRQKSFTTQVEPMQSKNFGLEVTGAKEELEDGEQIVTVRTEDVRDQNTAARGSDELEINVTKISRSVDQADVDRNVPGITAVHMIALIVTASVLYLRVL